MRINARKLELAMAKALMNPKEVSEKAGISYPALKRAWSQRDVKTATIGRIARALGVDVSELIETEE